VDFDDLIGLPLKLLQKNEEARAKWQKLFRHVLVDEYQDTNAVQYELLKALVGDADRARFTAVGDDDQSIYGWRGATIDNLKRLPAEFPSLKVIPLEQNYRSTSAILRAANEVISLNPKTTPAEKKKSAPPVSAGEIQKIELSNGLRLLVREDPRLPLISMAAVFRGGLLAETPKTNGITRLMAKVLLKGTKTRSAEQIADTIEAVGGSIGSDAGNNSFSVALDVTQPDLKLGIEILSDILLNATFPEAAIAREKEVQLAGIKEDEEQLTTVARNILREALFGDHPYALRGKGSTDSVVLQPAVPTASSS